MPERPDFYCDFYCAVWDGLRELGTRQDGSGPRSSRSACSHAPRSCSVRGVLAAVRRSSGSRDVEFDPQRLVSVGRPGTDRLRSRQTSPTGSIGRGRLMRGTIQKKGKRWYAVVYDGVNPETGQYRRRWVPAGTRRGDAEKLLADLVKRSHQGETVVSEKLTFGEYLTKRWLPVQRARLRPSTYDSYRRNIDLHVIPSLGGRQLDRLTVEDVDVFYATLLTIGRKKSGGSKGLSPKSVHNIHVMLNKALGDAARKGTVVRNVVALADAPSLNARKRAEIKAWEIDQLAAFLDVSESERTAKQPSGTSLRLKGAPPCTRRSTSIHRNVAATSGCATAASPGSQIVRIPKTSGRAPFHRRAHTRRLPGCMCRRSSSWGSRASWSSQPLQTRTCPRVSR